MATLPAPVSKVNVDSNFEKLLKDMRTSAQAAFEAVANGQAPSWQNPSDWTGDVDNWEDLHKPFSRDKVNEAGAKALSDGASPGVVGDIIAATAQADYLACAGRAFSARHCSRVRRLAMTAARFRGQGDATGAFTGGALTYVNDVLKKAKTGGET